MSAVEPLTEEQQLQAREVLAVLPQCSRETQLEIQNLILVMRNQALTKRVKALEADEKLEEPDG